jgi:thiosulfate/3-mercaptopyruvate sulfurtransferase
MSPIASFSDLYLPHVQLFDLSHPYVPEGEILAGAVRVHLNSDLSDVLLGGGRHPLPDIQAFSLTLQRLGITPNSHLILYDQQQGANAASRFWWMLKALGHTKVQVLNGGLQAALKAGFPSTSTYFTPRPAPDPYPVTAWLWPVAEIEEVAQSMHRIDVDLIDVRDPERFAGNIEPLDPIAGHIPGAINVHFKENLDHDGNFLSPEELRTKYAHFKELIVHCGSGVTACHTILAMNYAGLTLPKLYVGSWSEWCTTVHRDKP